LNQRRKSKEGLDLKVACQKWREKTSGRQGSLTFEGHSILAATHFWGLKILWDQKKYKVKQLVGGKK
jgi:hypothetical protein